MRRSSVALLLVCAVLLLAVAGCSKGAFVGSNLTSTYHTPDCVWAENIDADRQVWFQSAEEAQEYGYSPCGTCCP